MYELKTPANALRMDLFFTPVGTDGYGTTASPGIVEIYANDGSTIIGRMDYQKNSRGLSLPANENDTYYLVVDATPGQLGGNPFYLFKWQTLANQNQQEADNSANDSFTNAEIPSSFSGPGRTSYFFGGNLAGGSDTDWWSFTANAGNTFNVFCNSLRNGSGVLDMTVKLYHNPINAALESEVESETADLAWFDAETATRDGVAVTDNGTHYLSISASMFSADVTDRHYQCGVHVLD